MVDGTNLYAYCRGNPVKLVDPEGKASKDVDMKLPTVDINADSASELDDSDVLDSQKENVNEFSSVIGSIAKDISSPSSSEMPSASSGALYERWKIALGETADKNLLKDIYGNVAIPKPGDKPSDLSHLIEEDYYYLARKLDFELRNPGKQAPDYYENYGTVYLHKFKYETRANLSQQGQKWLDQTLRRLQDDIEKKVIKSKGNIENDSKNFENFAFFTHENAYIDSGLFNLPLSDLLYIAQTPDFSDLLKLNSIIQIKNVILKYLKQKTNLK